MHWLKAAYNSLLSTGTLAVIAFCFGFPVVKNTWPFLLPHKLPRDSSSLALIVVIGYSDIYLEHLLYAPSTWFPVKADVRTLIPQHRSEEFCDWLQ